MRLYAAVVIILLGWFVWITFIPGIILVLRTLWRKL